ncbi:MAG: pyridoxal-phosphate dependent enzyme [Proteobacteria bacterium]|nr:pyridoxal-phosphate dependent enzyme [Pseudomonadota bacterium]
MYVSPEDVVAAGKRIAAYTHRTPILESHLLNSWFGGHRIHFKIECHQRVGAFKARGAIHALLALKERGVKPEHVVAFSSGNHAQAVAWAGRELGIPTTIYLPEFVSSVKKQATRSYGAKVVETKTRMQAEEMVADAVKTGATLIPPYDSDDVIAGQGTAALEAFEDADVAFDAAFAPIGGGGLVSGTWLAAQAITPATQVFGAEPLNANDAARSLRDGKIFRWPDSPDTIADGARTLAVSERTFHFIKKLGGIFEVTEEAMMYWTQWLTHLLKVNVEPTSAMGMAAAQQWIANLPAGTSKKNILVIISGGNLAPSSYKKIWDKDFLIATPAPVIPALR